jgi:hypothetical protein
LWEVPYFGHALQQTAALPNTIALGKEGFALSKAFAECRTRQRAVGISLLGKARFAEGYGGTPQRKAAVTPGRGDGPFAECHPRHLAKKFNFFLKLLCPVPDADTRQSVFCFFGFEFFLDFLCRVLGIGTRQNNFISFF